MNVEPKKFSGLIIVDWGTTSLRAALVDAHGNTVDVIETQRGIQFIQGNAYEAELVKAIGHWLNKYGTLRVVALGMITSRNGWVEVPYVSCPATVLDLAAGTIQMTLPNGSDIVFLAGINDPSCAPFPDVMRGEETQIVGFGLEKPAVIVLPGTHCKWAQIQSGSIERFQTFVTGEIYALLSQHSFIAKVGTTQTDEIDWTAFERGVTTAKGTLGKSNSLLSLLFSARTGMLAKQIGADEMRDYVSGILIGYEFREAHACGWFKPGDEIGIVGNDGLNTRYDCAANLFDLGTVNGGEEAAIRGAMTILECVQRQAYAAK